MSKDTPDFRGDRLLRGSGDARQTIRASILWIDDEVDAGHPLARLITRRGFRVDTADCGASGLAMALATAYDAIILDLRLPDIRGLAVLERLRDIGVACPVLVLTGYGDIASAFAAGRLGVVDFRQKPISGAELVAALARLIDTAKRAIALARTSEKVEARSAGNPESTAVRRVLGALEAVGRLARATDATQCDTTKRNETKQQLLGVLCRALIDPGLSVPCFLACAQAVLRLHIAKEDQLAAVIHFARNSLAEAAAARGPTDSRVVQALTRLEASIARGVRTSEASLAAQLGLANEVAIDRAHLGRLFLKETGLGFREWRRALTMKVAVTRLEDTGEQVAAIAHGLGFEHPGQFDREFRQLFGITPGGYRRLATDVISREA